MLDNPILRVFFSGLAFFLFIVAIVVIILLIVQQSRKRRAAGDYVAMANKKQRYKNSKEMPDAGKVTDSGLIKIKDSMSFVRYVRAGGVNYYEASLNEQSIMEDAYINMWKSISSNVQYTVQTTVNRIDGVLDRYKRYHDELSSSLSNINAELDAIEAHIRAEGESVEDEVKKRHTWLENEKEALEGMITSNEECVRVMVQRTNNREFPKRRHLYVLRYDYNPSMFQGVELTEQEIITRAERELNSQANSLISSLKRCQVDAWMVTELPEVIDIHRKHFRIRGGDIVRYKDLQETNMDDVITTSTAVKDKRLSAIKGVN